MSIPGNALIEFLKAEGIALYDNLAGGPASAQSTALPLLAQANRVTSAIANASFQLKSLSTGEGDCAVFVINDSTQTIQIYPAVGEKQNGVANAALAIPSTDIGIFFPVFNRLGGPDWRSAAIA
jgi:hypothetical protein